MTNVLNDMKLGSFKTSKTEGDEKFDIPLDIADIISVCEEYSKLGWQIQKQIEYMIEMGIEDSIKKGHLKKESLSFIKNFLHKICENCWFGDAAEQANTCIFLIEDFEIKNDVTNVITN